MTQIRDRTVTQSLQSVAYWMEKGCLGDQSGSWQQDKGPSWLSGWGGSGTWQKSKAHQRLTQGLETLRPLRVCQLSLTCIPAISGAL